MKIEEALKQDFGKMTPQQRSHLRKRILAAGRRETVYTIGGGNEET